MTLWPVIWVQVGLVPSPDGVFFPLLDYISEIKLVCEMKEKGHLEYTTTGFPWWLSGEESTCQCLPVQEMWVRFLSWEDPLEKEMTTHCSILAWKIPWTEEPGGLQSADL